MPRTIEARKDMRNVSIFQPGISGKWKARPGMFGNKGNERGNGIHQPPWNPTAFSLLKWEVRNRHKQLGNQPRKQINHKDENKFNNNADNLEWCDNQYNNTYNGKHNKIAKPVIQRSKAGNEIARYKSIREAERKTGIKNITITRCCKGVYKTAGGYVWEYNLTIKEILQ